MNLTANALIPNVVSYKEAILLYMGFQKSLSEILQRNSIADTISRLCFLKSIKI